MKTKTLVFANNKGGSGKSTTCANIAYSLNELGHRVLAIDTDMQMNLSLSFFEEERVMEFNEGENNLYKGVLRSGDLEDCIFETRYKGLDIIPSSMLMSGIEEVLYKRGGSRDILKGLLRKTQDSQKYDYILIDAPPTLGLWVRNILNVSDGVVIPVEASPWGLFGLANMIDYVNEASKDNKKLKICGIVVTKVDVRKNYFHQTEELLSDMEDIRVFKSFIRVDSSIEWAQDNSMPVGAYKKSSRSAKEYRELAAEIRAAM